MRKFAIFLILLAAAVPSAKAQLNGVTVELQLDQNTYLTDEDLQLKVHIVNRSGQPLVLGEDNQWIAFQIIGEREFVASKLADMPVKGPFVLQSGEAITKEFNPTPYFGFRRPGVYSLAAIVKLPKWKQQIKCRPIVFNVSEGIPLANLGNLSFGVPPPPGVTNAAPVLRRYSLVSVTLEDRMKLYFRLTDGAGQTLRVFPLARMVSFGSPEVQMDRANNLHVLFQTGARDFDYSVISPNGVLLARQLHEYTDSRPSLHLGDDGRIFVGGGRRLLTMEDVPPSNAGPFRNR